jgi:alanine-glyoxylate transaminase/serine-glyoxylate transaminase/serine-pyruvate transaminase
MKSFDPPRRVLMGPGPTEVAPRVLAAQAMPAIGHLDPSFQELMEEIKRALCTIMKAPDHACVPLPAPGTAGMEAAIMNLVQPGDRVVVCTNGVFGGRLAEMARRAGGTVTELAFPWGTPVDVDDVANELKRERAQVVAFVHAETSTGVRSDAAALCRVAEEQGAMTIVDCVTSLGGIPVDVAGWGADVVYSGTQKCLSAPPGLSPIAISPRAAQRIASRSSPPNSWLFDFRLLMSYWGGEGGRTYHHTAPVNALYGLHEALVLLLEEGLDNAIARHARVHSGLAAGIEAAGLDYLVAPEHRLPQLNTIVIPEGIDDARIRDRLLRDWNLEIGGGLGDLKGRIWRIGLMGAAASPWHVRFCLSALAQALIAEGFAVDSQAVSAAVDQALGKPN